MTEEKKRNPFDIMFFLDRKEPEVEDVKPQENTDENDIIAKFLSSEKFQQVDWDEMMVHFDTIMQSLNSLKPLYKKISPQIERILKKESDS